MDIIQVGSDKRLSIGKEELVRPLPFGRNWARLRFSVWLSTTDVGGLAAGQLMLGVCEGPNGWHSSLMTEAIGVGIPGAVEGGGAWSSQTGPPTFYRGGSGTWIGWKLNGVVQTSTAPASAGVAIYSDGTNLTHVAGDLYRMSSVSGGSQTWLVQGWGPYSTPTADPLSNFQYLYAGEAEIGSPPYTGAIGGSNYSNITYTGKGNFTHFFMSWNNDTPKLQISMVNIIRFAA